MDVPANFSGTMSMPGTANRANKIVTTSVIMALQYPDTLKPIISTMSNTIGMTEMNAVIGGRIVLRLVL